MKKEENKRKEIIANIVKNVSRKKWKCILDNCDENAINSHLLQQNGILDKVVESGHLVELKKKSMFEDDFIFKEVGIKDAISIHLYCQKHDTDLFKYIETKKPDFDDYGTQILFSYRATCAEIRHKEENIEVATRLLNSNILDLEYTNPDAADTMNDIIESHKIGIKDLSFYKEQFESYLTNQGSKQYEFITIRYKPLKICASSLSSPLMPEEQADYDFVHREEAWNTFFINVIPQLDHLYIIIGYHKNYVNDWIINYIESWKTEDEVTQQINLTELLATRIVYWGMSRSIFATIPQHVRKQFTNFWDENKMDFSTELNFGTNLFAGVNSVEL
jgi:hypothetical protein